MLFRSGGSTPLRVEAAALRGKPIAFMLMGPWTSPWREPAPDSQQGVLILLVGLTIVVLAAAPWLAWRNWKQGRGDRRGAQRLAILIFCVQMAVWLMRAHFSGPLSAFGLFLVALATSLFYALVIWTVYLAAEPYVRRRWPQTLISWTSALGGGLRDPIVGRDVLIGSAQGACISVVNLLLNSSTKPEQVSPLFGSIAPLNGLRSTLGAMLVELPQGIRGVVLFVFLLFLLRVLLRNQWLAGAGFALIFGALNFLQGGWLAGAASVAVYGLMALVMLRWGMLACCAGIFLGNIAAKGVLTTYAGEWFFANVLLVFLTVLSLTVWGAWTSLGGRKIFNSDLFE